MRRGPARCGGLSQHDGHSQEQHAVVMGQEGSVVGAAGAREAAAAGRVCGAPAPGIARGRPPLPRPGVAAAAARAHAMWSRGSTDMRRRRLMMRPAAPPISSRPPAPAPTPMPICALFDRPAALGLGSAVLTWEPGERGAGRGAALVSAALGGIHAEELHRSGSCFFAASMRYHLGHTPARTQAQPPGPCPPWAPLGPRGATLPHHASRAPTCTSTLLMSHSVRKEASNTSAGAASVSAAVVSCSGVQVAGVCSTTVAITEPACSWVTCGRGARRQAR